MTAALPDTEHSALLRALPAPARPYALLARFDRPIGWWLLYWPCAWGLLLAGGLREHWPLLIWFLIGSIAMRGAGCVYNDIVDRDLDARVARTRSRPLASGAVSLKAAWMWLVLLCLVGLAVLLQLPPLAAGIALASLAFVAVYPFMKRITWWPQAWLGIVFSWGLPVAWAAAAGTVTTSTLLLYAASMAWVIGYDTIYALQDVEDDALIGVRSSARALGGRVRAGVALFYGASVSLAGLAFWRVRPDALALAALLPFALHLGWQVLRIRPDDGMTSLTLFRSNRTAGLLMALACLVVGQA